VKEIRLFWSWPVILVLGVLSWQAGSLVFAQDKGSLPSTPTKGTPGREIPLQITAAQLEADQDRHLILFKGQVKAVYGDAILYADQLRVIYKPQKPKPPKPEAALTGQSPSPLGDLGGEKLDRIEAQGNVRFVQGERVATAQEAIYYKDREEIVLTGRPQVWRGDNLLKGERLVVHLDTRKVLVEGSPKQRVEALLYQTGPGGKSALDFGVRPRSPAPRGLPPKGSSGK